MNIASVSIRFWNCSNGGVFTIVFILVHMYSWCRPFNQKPTL